MHTVISVFKDAPSAQQAVVRLRRLGLHAQDLHLEEGQAKPAPAKSHGRSALRSYGAFLASLFGQDHPSDEVDLYAEAPYRGNPVLMVDAETSGQAREAARVMDECGAIEIGPPGAGPWKGQSRVFERRDGPPLRELKQEEHAPR
ncbi:MAG TPA: hypothetical protein VLJ19_19985 [Variovorax sp.]|nr:hypothetical protein [Variovorax sp.]